MTAVRFLRGDWGVRRNHRSLQTKIDGGACRIKPVLAQERGARWMHWTNKLALFDGPQIV
jgi:hypothetical protein